MKDDFQDDDVANMYIIFSVQRGILVCELLDAQARWNDALKSAVFEKSAGSSRNSQFLGISLAMEFYGVQVKPSEKKIFWIERNML